MSHTTLQITIGYNQYVGKTDVEMSANDSVFGEEIGSASRKTLTVVTVTGLMVYVKRIQIYSQYAGAQVNHLINTKE